MPELELGRANATDTNKDSLPGAAERPKLLLAGRADLRGEQRAGSAAVELHEVELRKGAEHNGELGVQCAVAVQTVPEEEQQERPEGAPERAVRPGVFELQQEENGAIFAIQQREQGEL